MDSDRLLLAAHWRAGAARDLLVLLWPQVVTPEAAEKARAVARAAAALLEGDGRSTSSSMSSSDPGAGSAASDVTAGSSSEP